MEILARAVAAGEGDEAMIMEIIGSFLIGFIIVLVMTR